jgi:hypothetical protein
LQTESVEHSNAGLVSAMVNSKRDGGITEPNYQAANCVIDFLKARDKKITKDLIEALSPQQPKKQLEAEKRAPADAHKISNRAHADKSASPGRAADSDCLDHTHFQAGGAK